VPITGTQMPSIAGSAAVSGAVTPVQGNNVTNNATETNDVQNNATLLTTPDANGLPTGTANGGEQKVQKATLANQSHQTEEGTAQPLLSSADVVIPPPATITGQKEVLPVQQAAEPVQQAAQVVDLSMGPVQIKLLISRLKRVI
jgi:hypothetical protein